MDPTVHVYNCSSADVKNLSASEVKDMGFRCNEEIPLEDIIWRPASRQVMNKFVYVILVLLWHVLPALLIDGLLRISGKKPM